MTFSILIASQRGLESTIMVFEGYVKPFFKIPVFIQMKILVVFHFPCTQIDNLSKTFFFNFVRSAQKLK